jgi:hypothetical protein
MTSKSGFKAMAEKFIEDSLEVSPLLKKIAHSITLVATESKRLAELMLVINNRLNTHEEIILRLVEAQKEKKEQMDYKIQTRREPTKPN